MGKLKIGIVGCGGVSNQKHFPVLGTGGYQGLGCHL